MPRCASNDAPRGECTGSPAARWYRPAVEPRREQIGPGRIERADWLDAAARLAPASVDLLYADPPFATGARRRGPGGAFDDRWPDIGSWVGWLRDRIAATLPSLRPTACVLLHVDWRTSHHARMLLDELLGPDRFVNHLVWSYGLGGSSPRRFARKHDDILFYAVEPDAYWFDPPSVPATSRRLAGETKKATDVLDIPSINNMARERTGYPTQKPLALLSLLVNACCPPGGVVLDPCCGSGTTLVAADRCARRWIGVDVSPDAAALARRRLGAAQQCAAGGPGPGSATQEETEA